MGLGEDPQVLAIRAPPLFAVRPPCLGSNVAMLTSDAPVDDRVDLPAGGPGRAEGVEGHCGLSGERGRCISVGAFPLHGEKGSGCLQIYLPCGLAFNGFCMKA